MITNGVVQVPTTASDHVLAGIEYEESGDRWAPGDRPKAGRFYQRAVASYTSALQLSPDSFDAAYNKARLQYKLAEERELLGRWVGRAEVRAMLEEALRSHKLALDLGRSKGVYVEDAMFNTSQVHVSLAENILAGKSLDADKSLAVQHLSAALTEFQKCLESQQAQYTDSVGPGPDDDQDMSGVLLEDEPDQEEEMEDAPLEDSEEWYQSVTVQEPTTPATLLDTVIELLRTLSTLLPLLTSLAEADIANGESFIATKLLPLAQKVTDRDDEVFIIAGLFRCAVSEALFRTGSATVEQWGSTISSCFDAAHWEYAKSADALCAKSDAHTAFAVAVLEGARQDIENLATVAWKHYAFASQALGNAAKLAPRNVSIHIARGDTELIRSRIDCSARTEQVRGVLRKNAGVFYRGAVRLGSGDVAREAEVKELVLRAEGGEQGISIEPTDLQAREILEEAVEEGVFGWEVFEMVFPQARDS
jgi:tetratricopeptide (TPR) repeat protein